MKMTKYLSVVTKVLLPVLLLSVFVSTAAAQGGIVNKALPGELGGNAGNGVAGAENGYLFALYFVRIWNSLNAIGAMLVIYFFILGAFDWLTSAGDKGKLESARNKMLNAVIGIIILVSLYTIIGFISDLFFGTEFNILAPTFIDNTVN
jgi:hypothetical protein